MIKSAAYYFGAMRRHVFISQFSHAHISPILSAGLIYGMSPQGDNVRDRVAEWGIPPRRQMVPPMATVSPIGSNRLSFSREKVLKLTYSKVETQICEGNALDSHFRGGRRGREEG